MPVERRPITPWGYSKLRTELKRLREIEIPANIRAIEEARSHGDLSENAEYKYAKEQQSFIIGRERELETLICTAEVINPASICSDRIVFGATCTLLDVDSGDEVVYTIVGEPESNAAKGRVSVVSPIARSLIGKRIGDEATVIAPKGKRTFEVLAIRFLNTDSWDDD